MPKQTTYRYSAKIRNSVPYIGELNAKPFLVLSLKFSEKCPTHAEEASSSSIIKKCFWDSVSTQIISHQ
jgi:hypothetical protein